jgi:hypothetical protein
MRPSKACWRLVGSEDGTSGNKGHITLRYFSPAVKEVAHGIMGEKLTFVSGKFRALLTLSKLVEILTNASYTFRISIVQQT